MATDESAYLPLKERAESPEREIARLRAALQRAEAEARLSRERLDLAVRSSELGLWYCDLSLPSVAGEDPLLGRLASLRSDASLAKHFGLPAGAVPEPKDLEASIHPEDRDAARAAIVRALDRPGPFAYVFRTRGADGRTRWIRAIGTVSADEAGRAVRFDGVTLDVTEQKAIEDALREAARRKDDFLALLGHELRNPLAAIRNSLALLERPQVTAEAALKARRMMVRQLAQLTRLVDDLLDVSRISRGKIELKRDTFDIAQLVRSTVEDHRTAAETRGLRLSAEVAASPLFVHADAARVGQALGNLLQNALKFSQKGGAVHVRLARSGDAAELEVVDEGIGMDTHTLQTVFEPFRQVDHRRGGLGLGLSVARRLVELNGGTLGASSAGLGKGSRLSMALPLSDHAPVAAPPPEPEPVPTSASRRRVLIVEDNADAAESLAAFLELIGHEVSVAGDGKTGIERARSLSPDIVLCDIDLPVLDGYEVAAALRREPALRGTYLVAMTGYGQAEDKRQARERGFDAHLTKPTDPADLERLLARLPAASPSPVPSVERTFF
jgi:PAS domain S-box-containing protein